MLATRVAARQSCAHRHHYLRSFTTTTVHKLQLAYDLHEPPNKQDSKNAAIVFIHGLFGSKKNNRSMSKVFARELKRPVYAIVRMLLPHNKDASQSRHNHC